MYRERAAQHPDTTPHYTRDCRDISISDLSIEIAWPYCDLLCSLLCLLAFFTKVTIGAEIVNQAWES